MPDPLALLDPLDIAARTAWGEARGEPPGGMQAVLNVIMHRAARPGWWGRDVVSVCLKPWQFSAWNRSDPNRAKTLAVTAADPQFRAALAMADDALSGALVDITDGADSYADLRTCSPEWATPAHFRVLVGNQTFYRLLT